jgi:two-component system LytT family response regulator
MTTVTAVMVDDEEHNRRVLKTLLQSYCKTVEVIGEAESADDAMQLIQKLKPQLVFLDVMMPQKNGFDLLKLFDTIDFEVIFVSAFNEYAVTAFDYNALGYILKPIDYNKLITAVNKALLKIGISSQDQSVIQFINTLDPHTNVISKVAVHHNEKVILLNIADIISIQAKEGISYIQLLNGETYFSSKDLKLFDGMFKETGNFARISKNTVLNLDHLKSYQKGDVCKIKMVNDTEFEVSRRKKTEILHLIRFI